MFHHYIFEDYLFKKLQRERSHVAGTRGGEQQEQEQEEEEHKGMPRYTPDLSPARPHRTQRKHKHETRLPGWGSQAN